MGVKTILVIEDNELNLKLIKSLLQLEGYRVLEAVNAETGLNLMKSQTPDLVLMDIQLPGMDGLEATRQIRNDRTIAHIPVVALTSYAMVKDREAALSAGCNGFIAKPIDTRTFIDVLRSYIGESAACPLKCSDDTKSMPNPYGNRILVVEDDPLNTKLLVSHLTLADYDLITASSGPEALQKTKQYEPDLILMDVMMPGMDGLEATRRLKADPVTSHIPVVLITALHGSHEKQQGLAAGAEDFLNKPINIDELRARVQSLMRVKRYREQLYTRGRSEVALLPVRMHVSEDAHDAALPIVLLVEDDEKDILLIQNYLSGEPLELRIVRDGNEALKTIGGGRIDLVLLDILLPGKNGFDICRHLRETAETQNIQVIVVTCLDDMENRLRGIRLGADDFLVKPIHREELQARVQSLLKKKTYMDTLANRMESALSAAIMDQLTGLFNHAYFMHFLDQEIRRSIRQRHPISLLMIDIDNFKRYNDTNGHVAGDAVLGTMGGIIRRNIRDVDFAARYGGEEFAVLLPYTGRSASEAIAERIRAAVWEEFADEVTTPVTVSIGGTSLLSGSTTPESLVQRADKALYRAKRLGKNRLCFNTPGFPDPSVNLKAVKSQ